MLNLESDEYKVLKNNNLEIFIDEVNIHLQYGWEVFGSPTLYPWFAQAMIRSSAKAMEYGAIPQKEKG